MERAQWDTFWVPEGTRVIDRDEILYISNPRPAFYLNQVFRTRPPRPRWPALVEEVCTAHAHTTAMWTVFDTIDMSALDTLLADAGYTSLGESDTMVIEVNKFRATSTDRVTVRQVRDRTRLVHHLSVMEETFGTRVEHPENELCELLRACTGPTARVVRMVAYDRADEPIATGAMNLYPELSLGYLWGGSTLPHARGQGAYRALLDARIAYAQQRNISIVGVYAIRDTSAPILARHEFETCGVMTKWRRQPAG